MPRVRWNVRVSVNGRLPMERKTIRHQTHFGGERKGAIVERDNEGLLTIQQVAELLHVPVSWVYGRTRRRSIERLPGIRLGKYWRFREEEIHAWVESQRGGHRAA
jgi:excisionase family DNA binding protein